MVTSVSTSCIDCSSALHPSIHLTPVRSIFVRVRTDCTSSSGQGGAFITYWLNLARAVAPANHCGPGNPSAQHACFCEDTLCCFQCGLPPARGRHSLLTTLLLACTREAPPKLGQITKLSLPHCMLLRALFTSARPADTSRTLTPKTSLQAGFPYVQRRGK
jgi:hypothetical protein